MSRRILLAGYGDLAQRLARRLLACGDTVFGLRRSPGEAPAGLTLLRADLLDPASLCAVPERLDAVVCTLTPDSRDEAGYRRAYIEAPRNLAEALGWRCLRWLFASSTAVYGGDDGRCIDDDTPAAPEGFNGRVLLEPAASCVVAAALARKALFQPGERVGLVLCGSNVALDDIAAWRTQFGV